MCIQERSLHLYIRGLLLPRLRSRASRKSVQALHLFRLSRPVLKRLAERIAKLYFLLRVILYVCNNFIIPNAVHFVNTFVKIAAAYHTDSHESSGKNPPKQMPWGILFASYGIRRDVQAVIRAKQKIPWNKQRRRRPKHRRRPPFHNEQQ